MTTVIDNSTVKELRHLFELNREDLTIFNTTWVEGYLAGIKKTIEVIGIDTSEWGKSQEALEPCPFCGEVPETVYDRDESRCQVTCGNPDCPVCPETRLQYTESEAIRLWNKRVNND